MIDKTVLSKQAPVTCDTSVQANGMTYAADHTFWQTEHQNYTMQSVIVDRHS